VGSLLDPRLSALVRGHPRSHRLEASAGLGGARGRATARPTAPRGARSHTGDALAGGRAGRAPRDRAALPPAGRKRGRGGTTRQPGGTVRRGSRRVPRVGRRAPHREGAARRSGDMGPPLPPARALLGQRDHRRLRRARADGHNRRARRGGHRPRARGPRAHAQAHEPHAPGSNAHPSRRCRRSRRRDLQGPRPPSAGVHRGGRRLPDRARAHVRRATRRAGCIRRLSRDAAAQPVAVHVLPRSATCSRRDAPHAHRRREPRDDGAHRARDGRSRAHALAARPRKRTSPSRRSSSRT
jgi:hypothetical protein